MNLKKGFQFLLAAVFTILILCSLSISGIINTLSFHVKYTTKSCIFPVFEPSLSNFTDSSFFEKAEIYIFYKNFLTNPPGCGIYDSGDGRHPSVKSAP